jgi:TPR repeat protein
MRAGAISTHGGKERGDAMEQCKLGLMYAIGEHVECDYKKAFHWFFLAAKQENSAARRTLRSRK